ncbi:MAG TPA: hypothetical protein VHC22_16615 [Pirellulales bacterium]|nr:hypothetical protein [Pirellulales bacterium]
MKKLLTYCRLAYFSYFSRPAKDRVLYRAIRRGGISRIVELGMEQGLRSVRMIDVAMQTQTEGPIRFTGIDLFEMSPASGGMSLKAAHCRLQATGARVRLVPGDPFSALAMAANHVGPCDLIVIGAGQDAESLAKAWFYVPRLLQPTTRVFLERPCGADASIHFELVSHDEIRRLAQAATRRTAA